MRKPQLSWLVGAILSIASAALGQTRLPTLSEITITATRLPARAIDVPQSISVVDRTDLESRNVRTTPESLQEEVGILVQETNFGGGSPFVRGQTGNRILVLVDGVRLNNSTFRFGPNQYLNTVDPFTVDRLEIVRGPGSVLYGSDALGGVINVITKRREDFEAPAAVNTLLRTQFGSAAFEKTVRFETAWNRNGLGFQGGVTGRDYADLRAGSPTGTQAHTGYNELDGDARLQYRFAPDHELAFAFGRVTQAHVPNTVAFTYDNEHFAFDPQERTLYTAEHRLGALPFGFANWWTTVSFHDQREVRKRQRFDSPVRRREEDQVGTIGLTSQIERPLLTAHRVTAGLEFYHDDVDSSRVDTDTTTGVRTRERSSFPDGSTYDTFGLFLQHHLDVGAVLASLHAPALPLTVVLGGRYSRFEIASEPPGFDHLRRTFDDVTGSVAATYTIAGGAAFIASASQGFRAPNLDDTVVLRAVPEQGGVDTPNPALSPERVNNYEGGLKADLRYGAGTLFYFYSDFSDLIERRQVGFDDRNGNGMQDSGEPHVFQRQNVGKAVVQGVEADAAAPVYGGLSVRANVAWIRGNNTSANEPFSRIPPVLGLAGLRYDASDPHLWVEFFARVAGAQERLSARDKSDRRIPPGGTPGWHTLNLRGGWTPFAGLELALAIENLTDDHYRLHGSGIDAPGINVAGSATWRF